MTYFEVIKRELEEIGYWIKNEAKFKRIINARDMFYDVYDFEADNSDVKWNGERQRKYIMCNIYLTMSSHPELFKEAPELTECECLTCPFCGCEEPNSWELDNDGGGDWTCPCCDKEVYYYPEKTITYRAVGRKPKE